MRGVAIGLAVLVAAGPAVAGPKAQLVTSEAGRFRARFPGEPRTETKEVATPAGVLRVTTTQAEAGRVVLSVSVTDYPDRFEDLTAKTLLDGVRDGLRGLDGKVSRDDEVAVGPDRAAGRDIFITAGPNVVRCRAVLVGRRLYQVLAAGRREAVEGAAVDDFFRSFEVLK